MRALCFALVLLLAAALGRAALVAVEMVVPAGLDRSKTLVVDLPDGRQTEVWVQESLAEGETFEVFTDIDLDAPLNPDAVWRALPAAAEPDQDAGGAAAGTEAAAQDGGGAWHRVDGDAAQAGGGASFTAAAAAGEGQPDWDGRCIAECATGCHREDAAEKTQERICTCIAECPTASCDDTAVLVIRSYVDSGCPGAAPPARGAAAAEGELAAAAARNNATTGLAEEEEEQEDAPAPEPEPGPQPETAEQRAEREAREVEIYQREEATSLGQWQDDFPDRDYQSLTQFLGAWEGEIVADHAKISGAQYNFTALGLLYIKTPSSLRNPANLPGMRMKYSVNWARSPHELRLVHIEHEYKHLPEQPCIFEFISPDLLAIQFPSPRVVEDEEGNFVLGAPVQAVRMGGDVHMERVVLSRATTSSSSSTMSTSKEDL
jgi:hypothetical protein